ncbi:MAG: hypothetical protein AAF125_03500 [Chloroflexota bacterium]
MPAETRRVQPGIYLMFLGGAVTEDEITEQLALTTQATIDDAADEPILLLDAVKLTNPLKVARVMPNHLKVARVIAVNSNRSGAVLVERLAQKLPGFPVEVTRTQLDAVARAKAIRGTEDVEDLHCDYLGVRYADKETG